MALSQEFGLSWISMLCSVCTPQGPHSYTSTPSFPLTLYFNTMASAAIARHFILTVYRNTVDVLEASLVKKLVREWLRDADNKEVV